MFEIFSNITDVWGDDHIARMSGSALPDIFKGSQYDLLKADMLTQWVTWVVGGIQCIEDFVKSKKAYPHIYSQVLSNIAVMVRDLDHQKKCDLASKISNHVLQQVNLKRSLRRREKPTNNEKISLLDLSGNPPRCWICQSVFSGSATETFLYQADKEVELPHVVDVYRPRGLIERDLRIEVEHKIPFSRGGGEEDNLALSCGWCNKIKTNHSTIYDVSGWCKEGRISNQDWSLPREFWVVRLLAMVGTCQEEGGCETGPTALGLTVAPIIPRGEMFPTNLKVTCYEHDPVKAERFKSRSEIQKLYSKSNF